MNKLSPFQQRCIEDARAIVATEPLPDSAYQRKACPECARLYMAWVMGVGAKEDYTAHRETCENAMGSRC